MKIIIITQEDPFYISIFFKRFFELYSHNQDKIDVIGIVVQKSLGNKSISGLIKRMWYFYGPLYFFLYGFKYTLYKLNYFLYKYNLVRAVDNMMSLSEKNKIEILNFTNVNGSDFIHFVKDKKVDMIVSVAASQIFRKSILRTPRLGCINIHNAPLPNYRGMLPNFWQMFHSEKYSVMTIHEMVEELDKGRIIFQMKTAIDDGMSLEELIKKTKYTNAEALMIVLKQFIRNKVVYRDLPNKKGSYFTFPNRKDIAIFKGKGYRII